MDYILFGIGAGSSLVLIGWLLRDWGPAFRDRESRSGTEVLTAQQLVDQMRWARFCGSCGTAMAIGGAFVLLGTMIALVMSPTDTRGATIVLGAFVIAGVGMLVWSWLFVSRFGVAGVFRPKEAAVAKLTTPGDDDALEEEHADPGIGPEIAAEPRTLEPATRQGIGADAPSPDAVSRPEHDRHAPDDAVDQASEEDERQRVVPLQVEREKDEEADADSETEPKPEEATIIGVDGVDAPMTEAGSVPVAEDWPEGVPAIEPVRETAEIGDVMSGDQEPGDGAATQQMDAAVTPPTAIQQVESDDTGTSEGETAEPVSGREEALQNLRQRRLGRLTRNRP